MELYNLLSDRIDRDRIKEYENLFRIYKTFDSSDVDQVLTALINRDDYYFLDDMLSGKEIKFVGVGTTTVVYRVDDKVIKFTEKKHEQNPIANKLYLLAPTITRYIPKDDKIMVLEIQDYLSDTYDGVSITKEDIANWNLEMEKLGYEVADPLCKQFRPDNFGFLKSYKDANIDEKIIDIPEWFKKRPLVLYDIDLIYKKEDTNKKSTKYHKFLCGW